MKLHRTTFASSLQGLALLSVAGLLLLAAGCTPGGGSSKAPEAKELTPEATNKISGKVEVVAFMGAFGIDFYQQAAKDFDAAHPGTTVTVTGDPRVWEQLRPRMVAGDPPDLMYPGWGMDHWKLASEGQLFTLDDALKSPAYDGKGTWGDTFVPSILKLGQKDGKQYVLPYFFNIQGMWYDPGVFKKHGWTVPQTFPQLLTLCDQIKKAGIAPITFQGKYPYYLLQNLIIPWIQSIGGIQAVNDIQNLKPGAWKAPAVLQAVQMIDELNKKGDFEKGAVGMTHTESQTEFVNGRAAMIPCGTWLHSEMAKTMPPTAQMEYFLPPVVPGGKGDQTAMEISIEPWMVPSKAKNPTGALAYFKYLTSLEEAKKFVTEKAGLMAIKGSDDVKLPQTLVEPDRLFKLSKTVYSYEARYWYPELETAVENALTSLLNGEITPEQFCDTAEKAAEKTRNDPNIAKHTVD